MIQPIDYFLVAWFVLVAISTIWVGVDQFRHNPEPAVMKWGFILVTLYLGPIGALLYVLADKEPRPGEHEEFTRPLWKQGIGSTIHCVAGDATGIIVAAVVVASLGLPMWLDLIIEYAAGFAFGLFVFQALFMKNMMGGSYWQNVRRSFLPEFISMNLMMAGMAPVMSLLMMGRDMRAMLPTELLFWAVMSFGIAVGFVLAYPVNVWMVKKGLKHGLMTVRPQPATHPQEHDAHAQHNPQPPEAHAGHDQAAGGASSPGSGHEAHQPSGAGAVTVPQLTVVGAFSAIALVVGMVAPANAVNMTLSAHDVGGLIMPPGMIMTRDTPAEAMRDMAAVDPRAATAAYDVDTRGDEVLEPARVEDGVRVFELTVSQIRWEILPGVTVDAYAYNGQIPGPRLQVTQGDRIRIDVTNELDESTTVHWHGLDVPNEMDGPAGITQDPIQPGDTYRYEYTVKQWGTFFYHSHDHADRQQALGLYGALIIDPADPGLQPPADREYTIQLQEWLSREGLTYPAMPMEGGRIFPARLMAAPRGRRVPVWPSAGRLDRDRSAQAEGMAKQMAVRRFMGVRSERWNVKKRSMSLGTAPAPEHAPLGVVAIVLSDDGGGCGSVWPSVGPWLAVPDQQPPAPQRHQQRPQAGGECQAPAGHVWK